MTRSREYDAQRDVPAMQKSREEARPDSLRCGGCNTCHGMTRINAQNGLTTLTGEAAGSGMDLRKPCASGFFQRNLGNSSFQALAGGLPVRAPGASGRIQRKCNCGGSCESCAAKEEETGKIQAKLAIGAANDPYEEEADLVAAQVMRMPDPLLQAMESDPGAISAIRRLCAGDAAVGFTGGGIDLDNSGGEPLSSSTREFMEPRFNADFSGVRVHSDESAHRSAAQIRARAFTYGNHVWLGKGESEQNRGLLAHELTHVVQQGGSVSPMAIRRSVVVNPDTTAADDILDQFNFICPQVNFTRTGRTITCDRSSVESRGCECLTDVASDSSRTYTINVDTVSDVPLIATLHDGSAAILPNPSSGPRTYGGTNPVVHVPASTGSVMEFGAFSPSGSAIWCPNWRILGHELCGHGRLNQDCEEKGNRPSHNSTIDTENTIAAEHGEPGRGHFRDRRQGESFHNPVGDQSRVVFKLVNGWHYEAP